MSIKKRTIQGNWQHRVHKTKLFSLINSCKSFNYSGLPSPSSLYPICTCLSQSQSLFCLDISPLIYLFVSSSSISPKFPLFNHKYIYWKRVNSYWYGGPHLISDFDFIISVYMLYILCVKCKFSLSIMLCQFIIINIINNNSLNIKP